MTDTGDPDEVDSALQRLFAGSAPEPVEPASRVLERIGPRLIWARRRRIAGQATAAALTVGAIGIGIAILPDRSGPETIVVADGGDSNSGTGSTGSSRPSDDDHSPAPSVASTPASTVTDPSTPTTVTTRVTSATSAVSPTPPLRSPTVASTTTIDVLGTNADFSSPGGSVTVRWSTAEVVLVSTDPAPGFVATTLESGPIEVEVDFYNASTGETHTIELELEDGELAVRSEDPEDPED